MLFLDICPKTEGGYCSSQVGRVMMVKLSDGVTWFEYDLDRFDLLYRNHASK